MKLRPPLGTFDGIRARLTEVKALIYCVAEDAISDADREDLAAQLAALSVAVDYATPTEVCPFCFGRGDGCRFCDGRGYVSAAKLKLAPTELIEMNKLMETE